MNPDLLANVSVLTDAIKFVQKAKGKSEMVILIFSFFVAANGLDNNEESKEPDYKILAGKPTGKRRGGGNRRNNYDKSLVIRYLHNHNKPDFFNYFAGNCSEYGIVNYKKNITLKTTPILFVLKLN
jgi:hypothetical protein